MDAFAPPPARGDAYFLGGLKIAGKLSLIGAIEAEFAAGTAGTGSGLAYRILEAATGSTSRACSRPCS